MTKIDKEIFHRFLDEEFFSNWRDIREITKRLSERGYSVDGKKIGRIAQMLTMLCRDSATGLERQELSQEEWKNRGKYIYKKVR